MEAVDRAARSTDRNRSSQASPSSSASVASTSENGRAGIWSCSPASFRTYSRGTMSGRDERNCPALTHTPRSATIELYSRSAFRRCARCQSSSTSGARSDAGSASSSPSRRFTRAARPRVTTTSR